MKGVTGYQLAVIITIIIAIVVIALVWVFMKVGTESFTKLFDKVVRAFLESIREILGPMGGIVMPGL